MNFTWGGYVGLIPAATETLQLGEAGNQAYKVCHRQWNSDYYVYCSMSQGRGEVLPHLGYIGMCRSKGYRFQAVYSGIRYVNQRVQVQKRVSFSRNNWLKILVQTRETQNDDIKNEIGKFKFMQLSLKATLGQGGFEEFSLVQGSKIQLNQL